MQKFIITEMLCCTGQEIGNNVNGLKKKKIFNL